MVFSFFAKILSFSLDSSPRACINFVLASKKSYEYE